MRVRIVKSIAPSGSLIELNKPCNQFPNAVPDYAEQQYCDGSCKCDDKFELAVTILVGRSE